jgi:hypothetical protein
LERLKQKGVCRAVCDAAWQEEVDEATEAGLLDRAVRLAIKKYGWELPEAIGVLGPKWFSLSQGKEKIV